MDFQAITTTTNHQSCHVPAKNDFCSGLLTLSRLSLPIAILDYSIVMFGVSTVVIIPQQASSAQCSLIRRVQPAFAP